MIEGTFIQEKKNRFLSEVLINDEICECYIPSSCHLSNFVDLHGRTVLLTENKSSDSRTKYRVCAIIARHGEIPLDMALPNRVLASEIHRKMFGFLGKRKHVLQETTEHGYKCDLYIQDTKTIIEIKSVLSLENTALFPTVYSERAVSQLRHIQTLIESGVNVCYCFVSLSPSVMQIRMNEQQVEFYQTIQKCIELGMQVYGFSLTTKSGETTIKKRIPVCF